MNDPAGFGVIELVRARSAWVLLVLLLFVVPATAQDVGGASPPQTRTPTINLDLDLLLEPRTSRSAAAERPSATDSFLRDGLKRVDWLQSAGAFGLAERVLINQRPPIADVEQWIAWERRLWDNYRERRQWDRLAERVEQLPLELPEDFLLEARSVGVEALMQQRQFPKARDSLRKLLVSKESTPAQVADWRRKVFTTYLWDDDLADADAAMRRYQDDYFPDDHGWNILRARILIRLGDPVAAVSQVASVTTPEGVLVGLFGRLYGGSMTPAEVIEKALAIDEKALDDALRRERWALVAEAARRGSLLPDRVRALERALAIIPQALHQPLVEVNEQDLVDAYVALAESIANSANLLVGDFDAWLQYADSRLADSPIGQRAVFAYTGRSAALPNLANETFSRLAASLRQDKLKPVIFELFGEGKPLGGYEMLRGPIGYLLSEEALDEGDIRRAAALSAPISQPPAGVSYFDWRLRQARMSIYAGRIEDGVETLDSLTGALDRLKDDETDRLLQVIFDLQALDRHEEALPLLERVLELVKGVERQREVLYWIAESLEGSGQSEQAALYFLRSATMDRGNAMWSQSAQYRAAGALQKAGMIDDARALYRRLLAATADPSRREQLTRKLQDLWLLENKAAPSPPGSSG